MKTATSPHLVFNDTPPEKVFWGLVNAPIGQLMIGATETGAVCRTTFVPGRKPEAILKEWQKEWPKTEFIHDEKKTAPLAKTIAAGKPVPALQMTGTKFQQKVWKGLLGIPSGETISYGTLAKRIKNPKAARAVGSACGANPVLLLVPCHRVIANDGGLGGFGSGLGLKRVLLEKERRKA